MADRLAGKVHLRASGFLHDLPDIVRTDAGSGKDFNGTLGKPDHFAENRDAMGGRRRLPAGEHTRDAQVNQGFKSLPPVRDKVKRPVKDNRASGNRLHHVLRAPAVDFPVFSQKTEYNARGPGAGEQLRVPLHGGEEHGRIAEPAFTGTDHGKHRK